MFNLEIMQNFIQFDQIGQNDKTSWKMAIKGT